MPGADDRTEKPTAKHRDEARQNGTVAKSQDLNGAVVMMAGLAGVLLLAASFGRTAGAAMQQIFDLIARPANVTSGAGLRGLVHLVETALLKTVAPVAGICLAAGIVVNVAQAGLKLTPKALRPSFAKLNPMSGAKRIFGPSAAFETVKAIAKVVIVGGIVALSLIPDLSHVQANVGTDPSSLAVMIRSHISGLAIRAAAGYLLIGVIDYVWQRRKVGKSLKMTKQQVKDEAKQQDLPPEVKGAIRRRQYAAARTRMMAAVPRADVVVTNPTHFAVALEYNGDRPAPVVIAKGKDNVALQIRRIATENNIPIVENKPLARELHRVVALDQMIPGDLYQAVAEVLAFVYRTAARRRIGV